MAFCGCPVYSVTRVTNLAPGVGLHVYLVVFCVAVWLCVLCGNKGTPSVGIAGTDCCPPPNNHRGSTFGQTTTMHYFVLHVYESSLISERAKGLQVEKLFLLLEHQMQLHRKNNQSIYCSNRNSSANKREGTREWNILITAPIKKYR